MPVVIGSGRSTAPTVDGAVAEALVPVHRDLGSRTVDVAFVFVSGRFVGALDAVAARVQAELGPRVLAGATALGTIERVAHAVDGDSVVVWAAHLDGGRARCLRARMGPDGHVELPDLGVRGSRAAIVVLADQYTIRVDRLLHALHAVAPAVPVIGGVLSVRPRDDAPVFVCGGGLRSDGALVVLLDDVEVLPVVAGGAVALGGEHVVTSGGRNVISRLGDEPAADVLARSLEELRPTERQLVAGGARIGVRRGPSPAHPWTTHFILDVDAVRGTVSVGGPVAPGDVVQLQAFDRRAADRRIRSEARLCRRALGGDRPAGVLSFVCASRDVGPDDVPHRDAVELLRGLGVDGPHAGFLASGEVGPAGGSPSLHGFTVAAAVFPASR